MILDKSVNLFDTLINDYSGFNLIFIHLSLNLISQFYMGVFNGVDRLWDDDFWGGKKYRGILRRRMYSILRGYDKTP